MNHSESDVVPVPFPMIGTVLTHRRTIPAATALLVALLLAWLGFRTGIVDLYAVAAIAGLGAFWALQVAIEVVALVAETLMPR